MVPGMEHPLYRYEDYDPGRKGLPMALPSPALTEKIISYSVSVRLQWGTASPYRNLQAPISAGRGSEAIKQQSRERNAEPRGAASGSTNTLGMQ